MIRYCVFVALEDTHLGDGDGRDDGASVEVPQAQGIGLLDTKSGLENGDGNDKVRGENNLLVKVDAEAVGRELLAENVEGTLDILGPLVDDVATGISLNKTARSSANGTAHVGDEETTTSVSWGSVTMNKNLPLGLGSDLVDDGAENTSVAVVELGVVGVRGVKVIGGVLSL